MDVAMKPAKGTEVDVIHVHHAKVDEMKSKGWVVVGEEAAAPASLKTSTPKLKPTTTAKTED
jgi:hypothetical protein